MKARIAIALAIAALVVAVLGWTAVGQSAPSGSPAQAELAAAPAKHTHKAKLATKIVRKDLVIPAAIGSFEDGTFVAGEATSVAKCPRGWSRTGGGVTSEFGGWFADEPVSPNGWRVRFLNFDDTTSSASMFAVCSKVVVQKASA